MHLEVLLQVYAPLLLFHLPKGAGLLSESVRLLLYNVPARCSGLEKMVHGSRKTYPSFPLTNQVGSPADAEPDDGEKYYHG